MSTSPPGHGRPSLVGEVLGGYTLVREIGRGGMGAVYVGEHTRIVRRAAVKVLLASASEPTAVQRFFSEARAASMIRHPGIVEVFDCDVDVSGAAFIVMEYLEGVGLSRFIADGLSQQLDALVNVGAQMANAMAAAHEGGIVHRDLKPDNVFLCTDPAAGPGGRVKMLDFGIAKLLAAQDAPGLTAEGLVMGTPRYMSPEQCQGSRQIGPPSDIYSMGCILFQMACGRPPFVRDTSTELLIAHVSQPAPHPGRLAPALPPALDALIVDMLAKTPDARPASMRDVERRLREMRPGLPATVSASAAARDDAPTTRLDDTRSGSVAPTVFEGAPGAAAAAAPSTAAAPVALVVQRKRPLGRPALFAGAVVLLLGGSAVVLLQAREARRLEAQAARTHIDDALTRAGEVPTPAACRAPDHAVLLRLASLADAVDPGAGGRDPASEALRSRAAQITSAEEWAMLARVELAAGRDGEALAAAERALAACPDYPSAHYLAGKAADRLGQRDKAMAEYRRAVTGQDGFVPPRYNLALLQLKGGDSKGAAATLDQLIAWGPDVRAHLLRGQARLNTGDLAGAERDLRDVVRLDPKLADGWALLGTVQARKGDFDEAKRSFCRGKELGSAAAAANCSE